MTPPSSSPVTPAAALLQRRLLQGIGVAVLVWGTYLALGAAFNSGDRSLLPQLKGMIIFACFAGFLGFWGILLKLQKPRKQAWEEEEDEDSDS